jgi:membrane fusion protein, copper/silver efflux system
MKSKTIGWVAALAIVAGAIAVGAAVAHRRGLWSFAGRDRGEALAAVPARQLWHCGMHPQVIQDHPGDCPICHMALTPIGGGAATSAPASSSSDRAAAEVIIDPAVAQNMGVRTARVTTGTLSKRLRAVGVLSLPEPGMHDVSVKVGGWIDRLYADQAGMHVRKGEPLLEVYSPELQVAAQELIAAAKAVRALDAGAAQDVRREAENLLASARRKLRLWDVDQREIDAIAVADEPPRGVLFRSPVTGHVEEKMVVQGSAVQAGMKLLRIADHSRLWLDVQVYEQQMALVKPGLRVTATVEGLSGRNFTGSIAFVYPHVDPASRTLKVRVTLENPQLELKPGMYATAEIAMEPAHDAILCPREAVIDTGERQLVFIAEGDGHFASRTVRVGMTGDGDVVQILEGLAAGETVVTSGQFLMDVESRTIEAARKLGAPAPATQPSGAPSTTITSRSAGGPGGAR